MFEELFTPPYSDKIVRGLPILFDVVEKESRHGRNIGMEVGAARKQIIIGLLMCVYGRRAVSFPAKESHEKAISVNGEPLSIRTKMVKSDESYDDVKLTWTTDWKKVDEFLSSFVPQSHLLFINVHWEGVGGFFLITKEAQEEVFNSLGREGYLKSPTRGSNSKGVAMSSEAMQMLQEHEDTQVMDITWEHDNAASAVNSPYEKWVNLWEKMA